VSVYRPGASPTRGNLRHGVSFGRQNRCPVGPRRPEAEDRPAVGPVPLPSGRPPSFRIRLGKGLEGSANERQGVELGIRNEPPGPALRRPVAAAPIGIKGAPVLGSLRSSHPSGTVLQPALDAAVCLRS
jgi:hypothetical protein